MSALQHLSPDVLEVVRDVARQEDSFLLRVQGVPLRAFMGDVAPRVGPRAPFLSAAERHLLEHCREETAYLFELALYFKLIREDRPDAIRNRVDLNGEFAESFSVARLPRGISRDFALPASTLVAGLLSADEMLRYDWRTLAKFAMSLRTKTTTLANVALGWMRSGNLEDTGVALERVHSLRPGPWPDLYATSGHERFLRHAFRDSARAYATAWRLSNEDGHASCALLNSWLTNSRLDRDLETFARNIEGERLVSVTGWLRQAVRSSLNRQFVPEIVSKAKAPPRESWNHPATVLIKEALQ